MHLRFSGISEVEVKLPPHLPRPPYKQSTAVKESYAYAGLDTSNSRLFRVE
jgi:hypothetical protein